MPIVYVQTLKDNICGIVYSNAVLFVLCVDDGDNHLVAAGVFSQCETLLEAHRYCEGKVAQLIAELAKNGEIGFHGQTGVYMQTYHVMMCTCRHTMS